MLVLGRISCYFDVYYYILCRKLKAMKVELVHMEGVTQPKESKKEKKHTAGPARGVLQASQERRGARRWGKLPRNVVFNVS